MKMLWFPRIQFDIAKLHIATRGEMSQAIEKKGWEVKIAVTSNKRYGLDYLFNNYVIVPIIKIKYLRILSFWIIGFILFIYHYFKFNPAVVIVDIFSVWFTIPFVLFQSQKKLFIMDNRSPFYNELEGESPIKDKIMEIYTALSFNYCKYYLNGMAVVTKNFKNHVIKKYRFPKHLICVWENGVDIEKFSFSKFKNIEIPNLLKDKFVLLQHGAQTLNRGLLETIEAMSLINMKDIVLILIGDGPAKNEIHEKIKKYKLEKKVYVLPPVPKDEIPKYIRWCNCAIMAYPNIEYWNNNNPLKLLEYFAMGKVVICTDMWTFRHIAGDRKCVYYLKNNDSETIARAINYCYKNKEKLKDWGEEGIEIIKQEFTWDKQASKLIDFIKQLQGKN